MKLSLPSISMRHPVMVLMLLCSVVGAGAIAGYRMPVKFLPEMDFPFINCFIPYPGATPEQVEREVAIPAEGEFRTIPGLRRIFTTSNSDGCRIGLRFNDGMNMANASAEVRDRMERLKLQLPQEVQKMVLSRENVNSLPVMVLGLFRAGDAGEFIHLVRTAIQPRLARLDGVAEVQILASKPEPEVLIEFDQNRLKANNLPLYQVVTALQTANLNLSAGELADGPTKYYVRVTNEFRRPEDLANVIVSPAGARLKDVAKVGFRTREMEMHYDIDGKGGAFMFIRKESEANTVQTCHNVHNEIERIKKDPEFAGTESRIFFDQAYLIDYALDSLKEAGIGGAVMAIIVLYVFLLRFRPTIVVTMAIPTSIMTALAMMFASGMSLNVVSMVSLIVAVGMLVDDAIVVIENIYRHHQNGEDLYESSERGANEVGVAVTASTLTILVVFIPVFYMQSGEMAQHMKQFAFPMSAALVASLVVSFTLIPLATSRLSDTSLLDKVRARYSARMSEKQGVLARILGVHPLDWLIELYAWTLAFVVDRRISTILASILLGIGTYYLPYQHVGMQEMPTLDLRQIDVRVECDQNFDLDMANATFDVLKAKIDPLREQLGIKNVFSMYSATGGNLNIFLNKDEDLPKGAPPPMKTKEVMALLKEAIPQRLPGRMIKVVMPEAGGENRAGRSVISVNLAGDNPRELLQLAEHFRLAMANTPNLEDVRVDLEQTRQEMQLSVDNVLAANAGISPMIVARTVDVALRGNRLPPMKQGGREFNMWAQFREEDRKNRANLDNVSVSGLSQQLVPLSQLVDYDRVDSPAAIQRIDGRNVMRLTARAKIDVLSTVLEDLHKTIDTFPVPTGYTIDLGEEFDELKSNMANFFATILFASILVYIVMAALFESFILPLSILTSVPIAFIGVYWGLYIMRTPLDTIGIIGCVLMIGVVVRNGIVIVDHINLLRAQGMDRRTAIIQAGRDRFRPVIMTALTTALGVLPLAFESRGGSAVSFVSLGRAFISGLISGTILTLVVVPLFYTIFEDMQRLFSSCLHYVLRATARFRPAPRASTAFQEDESVPGA